MADVIEFGKKPEPAAASADTTVVWPEEENMRARLVGQMRYNVRSLLKNKSKTQEEVMRDLENKRKL